MIGEIMITNKALTGLMVLAFILLLMVFLGTARAAPFLIFNPQSHTTTSYIFTLNGVTTEEPTQDLGDGTVRFHYDLEGLAEGNHTSEISAKNIWRVSSPFPFDFTKTLPECLSVGDIIVQ
ncbi:MAG: hypothetical protein KAV87_17925 [Desulfobacteraceae bacterium]|nr:hypothetical protein [Desulfobacteraceae bacterium]